MLGLRFLVAPTVALPWTFEAKLSLALCLRRSVMYICHRKLGSQVAHWEETNQFSKGRKVHGVTLVVLPLKYFFEMVHSDRILLFWQIHIFYWNRAVRKFPALPKFNLVNVLFMAPEIVPLKAELSQSFNSPHNQCLPKHLFIFVVCL